jgi:hypothetical protein
MKFSFVNILWNLVFTNPQQIVRYKISHSKNSLTFVIGVKVREFNATFNNISVISWQSILLVEETGIPGENHRSYSTSSLSKINILSLKQKNDWLIKPWQQLISNTDSG